MSAKKVRKSLTGESASEAEVVVDLERRKSSGEAMESLKRVLQFTFIDFFC